MPRGGKRLGAGRKPDLPDFWCDWLVEQVQELKCELAKQVALDKETLRLRRQVYNPSNDAKTERLHLPRHLRGLGYEPPEVPVLSPDLGGQQSETANAIWLYAGVDVPPLTNDGDEAEPGRRLTVNIKEARGYMPAIYERVAQVFNVLHEEAGSDFRLTGKQVDQICRETRRRKKQGRAGPS